MSISCPECRHILTSGRKCHQPALRGQQFCTHHCHTRNLVESNRARKHSIALPPLEDRQAIQMAIDVVLAGLGAGKINRRTAATYAYAIKISSDNLNRIEHEPPIPPIEIVRTKNGDVLAGAPGPSHLGTGENAGCPGSPIGTRETTNLDQSPVTKQENGCPIHATVSPSHEWETTTLNPPTENPPESNSAPETTNPESHNDLRNTASQSTHDPEQPTPPTKTELREKRRHLEQSLKQHREALHYWSTLTPEQSENENPQMVIDYIQKDIEKCEAQLKEIIRLQAPDPEAPDPPL